MTWSSPLCIIAPMGGACVRAWCACVTASTTSFGWKRDTVSSSCRFGDEISAVARCCARICCSVCVSLRFRRGFRGWEDRLCTPPRSHYIRPRYHRRRPMYACWWMCACIHARTVYLIGCSIFCVWVWLLPPSRNASSNSISICMMCHNMYRGVNWACCWCCGTVNPQLFGWLAQ